MVDVGALELHPRNPNQGDFGAIHESVATNGFWGALVVQKSTNRVLVGNHRLAVSRELGITEVPVLWVDVDDEQALRVLTADNRTARLGSDNIEVLTEVLMSLASSDLGLAGTGFDGDDLDAMLNDMAENEPTAEPEPKEPVLQVVIACESKEHQRAVLAKVEELGYEAKAKG